MNIVKELRKKANIQQKELAISIGVSRPTVSEWESNKKDPSGERLKKLADFFGVDELMILGKGIIDYSAKEPEKQNPITARIVSGIDKMPEDQQERILAGLCNMFPEFFEEDDNDKT